MRTKKRTNKKSKKVGRKKLAGKRLSSAKTLRTAPHSDDGPTEIVTF